MPTTNHNKAAVRALSVSQSRHHDLRMSVSDIWLADRHITISSQCWSGGCDHLIRFWVGI